MIRPPAKKKYLLIALLASATVAAAGQVSSSSDELQKMFEEDQADRAAAPGKNIDWEVVSSRDETRERRVKGLLPPQLAPVEPDAPDQLRRELNVPTLAEAKAKEAQFAKEFEDRRRAQPVSEEELFQRTLTAHIDAIRNRDLKALTDTITAGDSLTLIFPNGTTTNTRQAYVDFHRKWFADQDWKMQMEPVSLLVRNDLGTALMKTTYTDAAGSRLGLLSLTFAREQGQWRLVFDQNTRIADK